MTALLGMLAALILGFLILGPFGAIIGLIMAGVLILRPVPPAKAHHVIEGHSPKCGCRKCLK